MSSSATETHSVDWYHVLGCSVDSTKKEIEKSVRKLSLLYHSDKTDDPDAPAKFLQVQKAKEILLDDAKRKEIDDIIKSKLKRKHHETQKMTEMNEFRKKMKQKLEKSMKDAQESNSTVRHSSKSATSAHTHQTHASSSTFSSSASDSAKKSTSKDEIDRLRRESIKRMEDLSMSHSQRQFQQTAEYFQQQQTTSAASSSNKSNKTHIKIKWKKSAESHSEDSLYQLLKVHGTIESINLLLDNGKGTSALVEFTSEEEANNCIHAYEYSTEYRVSLHSTEKKKKASVFTHNYNSTSTTIPSSSASVGSSSLMQPPSHRSESELLHLVRRAVEKETLRRSSANFNHEHTEGTLNQPLNEKIGETSSFMTTTTSTIFPSSSLGTTSRQPIVIDEATDGTLPAVGATTTDEESILLRMKQKQALKRQQQVQQPPPLTDEPKVH